MPRLCTRLEAKKTKIIITNFSQHKFLRVREGQRVAYFKKTDRDSVDVYAMDLAKLGTDHNAFIDLATLAEEQERVCTAEAIRVTDKPDDGKSEVNEKFSHITPEDVDIVDLPRISRGCQARRWTNTSLERR